MSKDKIDGKPIAPTPANLPEELVPVYEWFQENGKTLVIEILVAIAIIAAILSFKDYRQNQRDLASAALLQGSDVVSLEELNGKYGNSKSGALIRLQLAQAYYEEGKYENALEAYKEFADDNKVLASEARLGYAASLEALKRFDEAITAYGEVSDDAKSPAYVAAQSGIVRSLAANGKKDEAEKKIETLIADKVITEAVGDSLKGLIGRFTEFRKTSSIFEQMDAISAAEVEAAPAAEEVAAAQEDEPAAPVAE